MVSHFIDKKNTRFFFISDIYWPTFSTTMNKHQVTYSHDARHSPLVPKTVINIGFLRERLIYKKKVDRVGFRYREFVQYFEIAFSSLFCSPMQFFWRKKRWKRRAREKLKEEKMTKNGFIRIFILVNFRLWLNFFGDSVAIKKKIQDTNFLERVKKSLFRIAS